MIKAGYLFAQFRSASNYAFCLTVVDHAILLGLITFLTKRVIQKIAVGCLLQSLSCVVFCYVETIFQRLKSFQL